MFARALLALAALIAIAALLLASNGSAGPKAEGPDQPVAAKGAAAADSEQRSAGPSRGGQGAILRLRKTRFGKVIFEKRSGLVAYLFSADRKNRSNCSGDCAKAWPPIKTKGKPRAGSGLKSKDVGSIERGGGSRMVTYKGRPLYFYVHDSPGEILCHDVFEFGGDWLVVKKSGKPA